MPQLDKFTILFQFKSFFFVFFIIYFIFLFILIPLIHITLRIRKVKLHSLAFSIFVMEIDIFRLFLYSYNINRTIFLNFSKLNNLIIDGFLNYLNSNKIK